MTSKLLLIKVWTAVCANCQLFTVGHMRSHLCVSVALRACVCGRVELWEDPHTHVGAELLAFINHHTPGQVQKVLITGVTAAFSWICVSNDETMQFFFSSGDSDTISRWIKEQRMSDPYNDTRWEFLFDWPNIFKILLYSWLNPLQH